MKKKHTPKRDWAALALSVQRLGLDKLGEEDWATLLDVCRRHTEHVGLSPVDDRSRFFFSLGIFLGAYNLRELPKVKAEIATEQKIKELVACPPTETA